MEKSLKYYLSFICFVFFFSCKNETHNLNATEKRELAEKRYKEAIWFPQGSIPFQNGIAEAIKIDSTYDTAIRELSIADLKRGIPNKWKEQINKAVKVNPTNWQGYRGYNYLWFYRDYKKAIADFDATDTLTPNFIDAPQGHSVDYWRGIAYLGLKDYKNSISYFDKYINKEITDDGEDWVEITAFQYRGIAFFESGDYENAIVNFDKQLHYSENLSADAKYYKARIFKEQKRIAQAKAIINSAIEDFNNGYYNNRPYVETLRQIYWEDLLELKGDLDK